MGYQSKLSAKLHSEILLLSGVTRASRQGRGRWGLLPSHPCTAGINLKQALARSSCSCMTASIPPPEFIIKHQLSINISRKGWPGFTFMQGRCQALAGSQPFMFLQTLSALTQTTFFWGGKKKESSITPLPPPPPTVALNQSRIRGDNSHGGCESRCPVPLLSAQPLCMFPFPADLEAPGRRGKSLELSSSGAGLRTSTTTFALQNQGGQPLFGILTSPDCPVTAEPSQHTAPSILLLSKT